MSKGLMSLTTIMFGAIAISSSLAVADEAMDTKRMALAKQVVAYRLFDPNSATFRNVRASSVNVCGEVNAKNRYGGYVGYRTFWVMLPEIFMGKDPTTMLVEIDGPDRRTASQMCAM